MRSVMRKWMLSSIRWMTRATSSLVRRKCWSLVIVRSVIRWVISGLSSSIHRESDSTKMSSNFLSDWDRIIAVSFSIYPVILWHLREILIFSCKVAGNVLYCNLSICFRIPIMWRWLAYWGNLYFLIDMKKTILMSLILSLSILLLDIVTWRHECGDYGGDNGPVFYGFPFVYRTQIPWVNSFSGDFYIQWFLANLFVYSVFIFLIIYSIRLFILKSRQIKKALMIIIYSFITLFALSTVWIFGMTEWHFTWNHRNLKTLQCEIQWSFFSMK